MAQQKTIERFQQVLANSQSTASPSTVQIMNPIVPSLGVPLHHDQQPTEALLRGAIATVETQIASSNTQAQLYHTVYQEIQFELKRVLALTKGIIIDSHELQPVSSLRKVYS